MQQKKQIVASLQHPVIMYGYLGAQDEAEHEEAVRQWENNFTSSLEGEAHDEFRYNMVVLLKNVNIRAYAGMETRPEMQLNALPVFHAGVVFMHNEYPTWLYLFEYSDDMDKLLDEHPFNNFILKSGERYADAAKRAGIRFRIHNGGESPEYRSSEASMCTYAGARDGELIDSAEAAKSFTDSQECGIVSLPGWPNQTMKKIFQEASAQLIEQHLDVFPESVKELLRAIYDKIPVSTPIVYKIPLPEIDFFIKHVATSAVSLEDNTRLTILVQNDLVFECELGER